MKKIIIYLFAVTLSMCFSNGVKAEENRMIRRRKVFPKTAKEYVPTKVRKYKPSNKRVFEPKKINIDGKEMTVRKILIKLKRNYDSIKDQKENMTMTMRVPDGSEMVRESVCIRKRGKLKIESASLKASASLTATETVTVSTA